MLDRSKIVKVPWTEDDDKMLIKLANDGDSIPKIARFMGRTNRSVQGRMVRLNLRHPSTKREGGFDGSISAVGISRRHQKSTVGSFLGIERYRDFVSTGKPAFGVPMWDLKPKQCRWPVTEVRPHGFCGEASKPSSVYCEEHYNVAYDLELMERLKKRRRVSK